MTLLFDQNLSPILVRELRDIYPHCAHIRDFDLQRADDLTVWDFAIENQFIIKLRWQVLDRVRIVLAETLRRGKIFRPRPGPIGGLVKSRISRTDT